MSKDFVAEVKEQYMKRRKIKAVRVLDRSQRKTSLSFFRLPLKARNEC